jgi:hypothetical protein
VVTPFQTYATRCGYDLTLNDAGEYKEPLTYRAWRDYMAGRTEAALEWQAEHDADRWQPIETAPKDGTHILLRYRWAHRETYIAEGWWNVMLWQTHGIPGVRATAWQPLPAPPPALSREDEK